MAPWPIPDPQFFINRLQDEMNRVVERVWHGGISTRPFDGQEWGPAFDLYEYPDRFVLFVEVPGVHPNEIDVSHAANSVTIRGRKEPTTEINEQTRAVHAERRFGAFCRTVDLPAEVDSARVSAKFHGGVLEVTLPKPEANRPKSVKIEIQDE
ncbi:MAG: Hsp20/alpha crystallin family protein [Planctomycetota bacterium]